MTSSRPVTRLLVVRVGAMGDVLHALPAVAALRMLRPELAIDWVVDERWASLLVDPEGKGPVVSRVYLAQTRLWSRAPFSGETRRSVLALRRVLAAAQYDFVVDMQGTLRSAVIGSFAKAPGFAGFLDPREAAARWFYKQPLPRHGTHAVEQGTALLGEALGIALGIAPQLPNTVPLPRSLAGEQAGEQAAAALTAQAPFALLAPSAGWGAKQWPAERFAALARALASQGLHVFVNAASEAEPLATEVAHGSAGTARVVAGDVAQLIALTRQAAVVIGGDSGPVHLAAALHVPVVALFGPTDPARNGPWGAGPVRVLRHPSSRTSYKRVAAPDAGLAQIAVEEVLAAIKTVLAH